MVFRYILKICFAMGRFNPFLWIDDVTIGLYDVKVCILVGISNIWQEIQILGLTERNISYIITGVERRLVSSGQITLIFLLLVLLQLLFLFLLLFLPVFRAPHHVPSPALPYNSSPHLISFLPLQLHSDQCKAAGLLRVSSLYIKKYSNCM